MNGKLLPFFSGPDYSEDHKSSGCLVRFRHFLSQLQANTSVLTSSNPTARHAFSQIATMFLETYQQHTLLNEQTTPPRMKRTPFHKPLRLPHQRSRVQFLYQRTSTSQSQKTLTFPWDQVLASLWTSPPTSSFFPLRA